MDTHEFREKSVKELKREIIVTISKDCMSASLCLSNPYEIGGVITDEDEANKGVGFTYEGILEALSSKGIKMGVDDGLLHRMIDERIYNKEMIVAQGKPMENGADGYYEFFFDTEVNGKPTVRPDGSIDYYELKLFETVKEGDKLAQYNPPTKGVFGFNVLGKLLTPKPGKPKSTLRGKGFNVSEDGNVYYAAMSGKVEYCNYDLKIVNVLDINGDVDLNVGNIDFDGDVNISGNVITGVRISALGNIYIGGYVEGAILISEKDIVLNKGVNSKGVGKIKAKGNVSGHFFENAEVYSDGDVSAGYILNSNIMAMGKVIVEGNKGIINGGTVAGIRGVETPRIGNESCVPTCIRVGPTKKLQTDYANMLIKIKELDTQVDMYDEVIKKYNAIKQVFPEKFDQNSYTRVFQSKIIKSAEKSKYEEERNRLFDIIRESGKSVVKVSGKVHPGAKVYIDDAIFAPEDIMQHMVIRKVNDKIVVRDYDE